MASNGAEARSSWWKFLDRALVPEEIDCQPLPLKTRLFLTLLKLDRLPHHRLPLTVQRAEIHLVSRLLAAKVAGVRIREEDLPLVGRTLRLRIYTPPGEGVRPGLLYLHGGGWTVGRPSSYDGFCSRLALEADCVVLSLQYRLAPEFPYPAAVEDVEETFAAIRKDAEVWGVDPKRLAVGGDSAGGNLAAVLTNQFPELLCFTLLIYPGVDLLNESPSMNLFRKGFFLGLEHVRWFEDQYAPRETRGDPRVSPLRAERLGKVPTLVVTAGLDPLRDGGRAYARRLEEEGIPNEHLEISGMVHGFVTMDGILPAAADANRAISQRLKAALHPEQHSRPREEPLPSASLPDHPNERGA